MGARGRDALWPRAQPILAGVLAATLVLGMVAATDAGERQRHLGAAHAEAADHVLTTSGRLQVALNERIILVRSLAAFVAINPEVNITEFNLYAQALLAQQPGVQS